MFSEYVEIYSKKSKSKKGDEIDLTEWRIPKSKKANKKINLEINHIFNDVDG